MTKIAAQNTLGKQEPTPEALDAIRRELGLDVGPLGLLGDWLGGALRGDLGRSWVTGAEAAEFGFTVRPVGPTAASLYAMAVENDNHKG